MGIVSRIKNMIKDRNPTETIVKLVRESGNGVYTWNGELLDYADIRAMIRPFTQAAGKFDAKHIRETVDKNGQKDIKVNPEPYIRILLAEPNPMMTGAAFRQRMAWQYMLKNNAFAYIVRDANGFAIGIYLLEWTGVEALLDDQRRLYLRFNLKTGKQAVISYEDVIHVARDVGDNELFGSPNQKALETLMEVAGASDRSIIQAVKNGGAIKWLLKYTRGMRPEELKTRAKEFAKSFLDTENSEDGSIGVLWIFQPDGLGAETIGSMNGELIYPDTFLWGVRDDVLYIEWNRSEEYIEEYGRDIDVCEVERGDGEFWVTDPFDSNGGRRHFVATDALDIYSW